MDEKYKIYCKKISDHLKNASRDNHQLWGNTPVSKILLNSFS
jgi:hypothetical protein